VHGDARNFAGAVYQRDILLGADEGGNIAEEMHGNDGRADRNRPHPVGDRNDRGRNITRIELFHHATMQFSKPSRIICSGSSRPMKTRRLSRGSPSFQAR
jgi:hypothetical protein